MAWRLRRATAEDAEALALIGAATFLESYAGHLPGADIVAHCRVRHAAPFYAEWAARADHALWLVEAEGGAPIGYQVVGAVDSYPEAMDGDLELKRIYLLRSLHGVGVSRMLMDEGIAWAKAQGAGRLLVALWEGNGRAMAFYRRCGFGRIGARPFTVGATTHLDPLLALTLG
jgi:GNAT superfamily N-acetyltransferase